jgi:hypothetical protein
MRYYHIPTKLRLALSLLAISLSLSTQDGFEDANLVPYIKGEGSKMISDINLLLPVSHCTDCRKVNFNISAINGCY